VRLALKPWWEQGGGIKGIPMRLAARGAEGLADRLIGMRLLGDLVEFFRAFTPLYEGFRERATEVRALLRAPETMFTLVSGPGAGRIPDTLFFARKLKEAGHQLGPIIVNQVHPAARRSGAPPTDQSPGRAGGRFRAGLELFEFLGHRDRQGLEQLRKLLTKGEPLLAIPLQAAPPAALKELEALGRFMATAGPAF
jgi:anion-transporting  ArsA/GET3 family ATPase